MQLIPAIYLEPDDQIGPEHIDAVRRVVSNAGLALLRKTGRVVSVGAPIVRRGPALPPIPMNTSYGTSGTPEAADLFRTVAAEFPEADEHVVLCFVAGVAGDSAGLGASRAGYLQDNTGGLGLLGWGNMDAALETDDRDPMWRLSYCAMVVRALHEIGHVMGLPHPPGDSAALSQNTETVMGYNPGAFAFGRSDWGPVNPMLFAPHELAVVERHPLLRDAPEEWRPAGGMVGLYGSDLGPVISGRWPAPRALVLGMMVEEYS